MSELTSRAPPSVLLPLALSQGRESQPASDEPLFAERACFISSELQEEPSQTVSLMHAKTEFEWIVQVNVDLHVPPYFAEC